MRASGFGNAAFLRNLVSRLLAAMGMQRSAVVCAALVSSLLASSGHAHELQFNRVTLVQRDSQHLALTFFIDYVDAVYDIVAPERPFEEFVMLHSAMPLAPFKLVLERAHTKLVTDTQLSTAGGKALAISNWRWPDAAKVHDSLKQRAMQMVVGTGPQHAHAPAFEVQAEVTATTPISVVTVKLPDVIQPAVLVWYRPRQMQLEPKAGAKTVRF